jgi:hypothetical protein
MNENILKIKIKENERNHSIQIKNEISNKELKMNQLIDKFRDEENKAKDYLEQKNKLQQNLTALNLDINERANLDADQKIEFIDLRNGIDEHNIIIEEEKSQLNSLINDNERYRNLNEKLENEIRALYKKTDELTQKIELNNLLKDIDITELKMLSHNNAIVNSSINNLMGKWDKISNKLEEINKNKNNINNNNDV